MSLYEWRKFQNTTTPYHFIVPETFALGHMHRAVKTIEGAWRHLQDGRGPALFVKHSSLTTDRAAVFQQVMHFLGLARVWNDVKADFLSNSTAEQDHAQMANPLFGTGSHLVIYRGAVSGSDRYVHRLTNKTLTAMVEMMRGSTVVSRLFLRPEYA